MSALSDAAEACDRYSCVCRPTRVLLNLIGGIDMDAHLSLISKLNTRVELAVHFGTEAEDSPLWPTLNSAELAVLVEALEEDDAG
jgi:hypothetical protein